MSHLAVLVLPRAGRVVRKAAVEVHREEVLRLAPVGQVGVLGAADLEGGIPLIRLRVEAGQAGDGAALPEPRARDALVVDSDEAGAGAGVAGEAFVALLDGLDVDAAVLPVDEVLGRGVVPAVRGRAGLAAARAALREAREGASAGAKQSKAKKGARTMEVSGARADLEDVRRALVGEGAGDVVPGGGRGGERERGGGAEHRCVLYLSMPCTAYVASVATLGHLVTQVHLPKSASTRVPRMKC